MKTFLRMIQLHVLSYTILFMKVLIKCSLFCCTVRYHSNAAINKTTNRQCFTSMAFKLQNLGNVFQNIYYFLVCFQFWNHYSCFITFLKYLMENLFFYFSNHPTDPLKSDFPNASAIIFPFLISCGPPTGIFLDVANLNNS